MIIELVAYGVRGGKFIEIIKEMDILTYEIISTKERELSDAEADKIINMALDENSDIS